MKRSQFTDNQIMDALKRVDAGLAVTDVCRELGISSATFYKWRAKYGSMDASKMVRMKELEAENARLKKMYIKENLKAEILNEAITKKLVRVGVWWGLGAWKLVGVTRSFFYYKNNLAIMNLEMKKQWV